MRLIDADEIRIKPEYMHDICGSVMIRVEDVARILNEMPTINSQPRQKGKWLQYPDDFCCSECEGWAYMDECDEGIIARPSNFCPHCGADMREDT